MDKEKLFLKIINREIPADIVYETDNFIAFQALFQSSKGHTLIVPKEWSFNIMTMNPELGKELIETIQKVGAAMIKGLPCEGFNTAINFPPVIGEVHHTHIHLIPRSKDDGLGEWKEFETTDEERAVFAQKIITALD